MLGVNKWLRRHDGRREGVVKTKRMNMVLPSPSLWFPLCLCQLAIGKTKPLQIPIPETFHVVAAYYEMWA